MFFISWLELRIMAFACNLLGLDKQRSFHGTGGARLLNYSQVLEYLERDYGAAFRERIQSPLSDLSQREGPITPDKDGLVHHVGGYLPLQGYEELGQRALRACWSSKIAGTA